MTLTKFEQNLQTVNPKFRIKRYGNGIAGVFKGNQYLFRVPQGEIVINTVYEMRERSENGKLVQELMPVARGRYNLASLLHQRQHVTYSERNKIAR